MKKKIQQRLIALFLVFTFLLSSVAYVVLQQSGTPQTSSATKLTSMVVAGTIDPSIETAYLQAGYTFLKFYYANQTMSLDSLAAFDAFPERFSIASGAPQLIVQKISSATERVEIVNANTDLTLNATDEQTIVEALCPSLLAPSLECAFIKNPGTPSNQTNGTQ